MVNEGIRMARWSLILTCWLVAIIGCNATPQSSEGPSIRNPELGTMRPANLAIVDRTITMSIAPRTMVLGVLLRGDVGVGSEPRTLLLGVIAEPDRLASCATDFRATVGDTSSDLLVTILDPMSPDAISPSLAIVPLEGEPTPLSWDDPSAPGFAVFVDERTRRYRWTFASEYLYGSVARPDPIEGWLSLRFEEPFGQTWCPLKVNVTIELSDGVNGAIVEVPTTQVAP